MPTISRVHSILDSNPLAMRLKRWAWVLLGLIALCAPHAMAQPVKGVVYRDFLPMGSGSSLALPEGAWSVTFNSALEHGGTNWEVYTLVSQQLDAKVPFLVVRQTVAVGRWGNTNCLSTVPSQFLVNEHGTLNNQLLNKCSRAFAFNFDNWRTLNWANPSSTKWWSGALEGLPEKLATARQGILQVEMTVQQFNGKMLRVDAFVLPPKGVGAGKFRDDFLADRKIPEHQMLSSWTSIYIESMQQSFFNKRPQPIMALAYPTDAVATAAPVQAGTAVPPTPSPQLNPSTPSSTVVSAPSSNRPELAPPKPIPAPASAALPGPADNTAQLRLEQERRAIEEDKRKMAQQMELMTQMLARLQQENAMATAAAAKVREAVAASEASAKPSPPVTYANRKALVIGNDLYAHVPKLNNAGADAEAMAKSLESVGYKVSKHLNLDEKRFKQALRDFRQNLNGGDEVLFFFAGHGVQLGNANYLLPTDVKGDHEDQVKDDAILLQKVLDDMEEKKTKFALAVIDACRDNPFKGKGRAIGGRGLAPTSAATGQMIMFSAGSGQQALDRLGDNDKDKNGLFTRIFIKEMTKPGLSVDRILRNVRTEVVRLARSVGHEQTPALYDQAIGEFFFKQ